VVLAASTIRISKRRTRNQFQITDFKERGTVITLMMEAASTYETSVNFCQTTMSKNPEDRDLHIRRRENLKSHFP
jgi:hypothetical protein